MDLHFAMIVSDRLFFLIERSLNFIKARTNYILLR